MAVSLIRTVVAATLTVATGLCAAWASDLRWPMAGPDEVLDYSLDLSALLADVDDTIASVSVTVSPSGTGELAASDIDVDGGIVTVWLSGGVPGRNYTIEFDIVTNGGRVFGEHVSLLIDPWSALTYPMPAPPAYGPGPPLIFTVTPP